MRPRELAQETALGRRRAVDSPSLCLIPRSKELDCPHSAPAARTSACRTSVSQRFKAWYCRKWKPLRALLAQGALNSAHNREWDWEWSVLILEDFLLGWVN